MFKHIFLGRLKCLIRGKSLIFWTLIFPIILGTFFNFAFSNLASAENFKPISIAVVNNESSDDDFLNIIKDLSLDTEKQLFETTYTNIEEAENLLDKNEIDGIILMEKEIKLIVKNNGINQTILKSVLDNFLQINSSINNITRLNPGSMSSEIFDDIDKNYISNITNNNPDTTVIYFYTLLGMVCMYSGFFGVKTVTEFEANLSPHGKRLSISPIKKIKALFYSLLAGYFVQLIELFIIIAYLIFILGVDFGSQTSLIVLLCMIGCFAGTMLGTTIASISKKKEDTKVAYLVAVSMALSFLSGMMVVDLKYIILDKWPILAKINPVSLITDALYSLYYYDTYARYISNIVYLLIFSLIMFIITFMAVRRRNYESV